MHIDYKKYKIENNKNINIKIAHISDIHYSKKYKNKRLEIVKTQLSKINPDYICITGDLIDIYDITKEKEFDYFINWLIRLTNISKVIISIGNHEYIKQNKYGYTKQEDIEWLKKIENNKLIVLDNEIYKDNNITFFGFNPNSDYYVKNKEKYETKFNIEITKLINKSTTKYNILLLHTPTLILKKQNYKNIKDLNNVDLILCGHTHGGMVPSFTPGNFGIIDPCKRLFPKNIRGKINLKNTTVIISSGITKLSRKSRLTKFNDIYGININEINVISNKINKK